MKPAWLLMAAFFAPLSSFAQSGAPQRTIMENRVTKGKDTDKAQQPAPTSERAIDSLLTSTEDLNSIRDGYVRRLAGDGCRPDIAIRVAELHSRLDESGAGRAASAGSQQTNFEMEGALMILAAGWYEAHAEAAPTRVNRDAERAQLLDMVLSHGDAPAETAAAGTDRAQWKAELDRLLATCHGTAH